MRGGDHVRTTGAPEMIDDGNPESRTFFGIRPSTNLVKQDQRRRLAEIDHARDVAYV